MIPLGYLVIKRLEETRKRHSLGLVEASSLTRLDEAEPETEYSLDSAILILSFSLSIIFLTSSDNNLYQLSAKTFRLADPFIFR